MLYSLNKQVFPVMLECPHGGLRVACHQTALLLGGKICVDSNGAGWVVELHACDSSTCPQQNTQAAHKCEARRNTSVSNETVHMATAGIHSALNVLTKSA